MIHALDALIAQVEGATGGDREIDARVYLHISDARNEFVADDGAGIRYRDFERQNRHIGWECIPYYSRSLDAMNTLIVSVNLGWDWWVNNSGSAGIRSDGLHLGYSDAATPALALLSALLRALKAESEG